MVNGKVLHLMLEVSVYFWPVVVVLTEQVVLQVVQVLEVNLKVSGPAALKVVQALILREVWVH